MMCNDLWNCTQNKQRYYKFLKLICSSIKKKDVGTFFVFRIYI